MSILNATPSSSNKPQQEPPMPEVKPGDADRQNFKLHWTAERWRNFSVDAVLGPNDSALDSLRSVARLITKGGALSSPTAAAYWAYHVARTGFFASQGITSLLLTRSLAAAQGDSSMADKVKINKMFKDRGTLGLIAEALTMYYQDWCCIEAGVYKLPWDMTTPTNRQYNPLFVLDQGRTFLKEAAGTLQRRWKGANTDVWLQSDLYPDYYLKTFHYQRDGWFSDDSAKVYENSTETLFLGRQDAMQRTTLVPIHEYMKAKSRDGAGMRVLEVACGTGRFATFFKDNYPKAELTALDLSPYYLQEARQNMREWHRLRQPNLAMGGFDGSGVKFLQAPAEKMPEPDNSYDVVYSIYMFHELPPETRRAAAKEMARVLKPGGLLVLTDSMQLGDRPVQDAHMGKFHDFNEPWWMTYIAEDFGAMFKEVGLECDMKVSGSATKALSFRKPIAA
jgi:ubiquinone/menaquinone biosynthesis C-methylase UbiE